MRILLTGATGLIGSKLGLKLVQNGHEVLVVSRNKKKAQYQLAFPCEVIEGDLMKSPLPLSEKKVDAVIHLLGEGVADKKWSDEQKNLILKSRTESTKNLIRSFKVVPEVWIQASAIGIYGSRENLELNEDSTLGSGFLADVCKKWEAAADESGAKRIVKARLGIVLASQGGALEKMLFPFRAGVGGALASGQQWMSWIHLDDAVQLFISCLDDSSQSGVINFTSPGPETNREFSKKLAKALGRPFGPSVPTLAMQALFGEMSEVLLGSQKVLSKKTLKFKFQYPDLNSAFEEIFQKPIDRIISQQFLQARSEDVAKSLKTDEKLKISGLDVNWSTGVEALGGGTLVTHKIHYDFPLGYLGWLATGALAKKRLLRAIDLRRAELAEKWKSP